MIPQVGASGWSRRFAWMALVHGVLFLLVTALIAVPSALSGFGVTVLDPSIGMVIATGSAGTWFTVGYVFYFLIGVVAMGLFAVGYYVLQDLMHVPVQGGWRWLAWTHLVLMNAGAALSTYILMYAGYTGGAMVIAKMSFAEIHTYLVPFATAAGVSVLVLVVGVVAGMALLGMKFGGPKGLAAAFTREAPGPS